tara:strand:+ start:254 stop:454 length:201 start_codon:yes stop_codon:yes gene_type:complete
MSENLSEFIKVFAVVFGIASVILMLRSTFLSFMNSNNSYIRRFEKTDDIIDYDGMGDHSRFPSPRE